MPYKILIKIDLIYNVTRITLVYIKIHKIHHKDNRAKKFFVVESQPLEMPYKKQRPGLGYNHGLWI